MDDDSGMRGGQGLGELRREFQNLLKPKFRVAAKNPTRVMAVYKRHGDEANSADLTHVVNAEYVLVRGLASEQELLLEAFEDVRLIHDSRYTQ